MTHVVNADPAAPYGHPPPLRGLGETFPEGPPPVPLDDVPRAVARVKALFEEAAVAEQRVAPGAADRGRRVRVDRPAEAARS